ncbi:hypothetical protein [Oscillatoria acuminata]|uniref:hypothetical protein n=1 Tax=Oscillatoria acuminata TaxID=118323 RepID=UPI0012EAB237|nr:hypothetical protein [Oscillatoria acuminata]
MREKSSLHGKTQHSSDSYPHKRITVDVTTLPWVKRDFNKAGSTPWVFNQVMPPEYETTAEIIAQSIYCSSNSGVGEGQLHPLIFRQS